MVTRSDEHPEKIARQVSTQKLLICPSIMFGVQCRTVPALTEIIHGIETAILGVSDHVLRIQVNLEVAHG